MDKLDRISGEPDLLGIGREKRKFAGGRHRSDLFARQILRLQDRRIIEHPHSHCRIIIAGGQRNQRQVPGHGQYQWRGRDNAELELAGRDPLARGHRAEAARDLEVDPAGLHGLGARYEGIDRVALRQPGQGEFDVAGFSNGRHRQQGGARRRRPGKKAPSRYSSSHHHLTPSPASSPAIRPTHQLLGQCYCAEQRYADHAQHEERRENDRSLHP